MTQRGRIPKTYRMAGHANYYISQPTQFEIWDVVDAEKS